MRYLGLSYDDIMNMPDGYESVIAEVAQRESDELKRQKRR